MVIGGYCGKHVHFFFLNHESLSIRKSETRSSPQWQSGRSTTALIVFDLSSLIWDFDESCTIFAARRSDSF